MLYEYMVVEKLNSYGYKCMVYNLVDLDYLISCGAQPSQLIMPEEQDKHWWKPYLVY